MKISVIVPVHDGGDSFRRCLNCLLEAAPDEIIVVADGSTDGSDIMAEALGIPVIRLHARSGPAHARNVGAKAAAHPLLFFVDADVAVYPDTIAKIRAEFERQPDLAALIGSYDKSPAAANFLSQYKNLLHHFVHQTSNEDASTFWGACGAIRADVFKAAGGFDERYALPAIEDIELGYRLKAAGYRIRLCKDIQVKHLKQWTPRSLIVADFARRALPWTELILRDRHFINDLNLQQSSRLSVALVYLFAAITALALLWLPLLAASALIVFSLLRLNAPVYHFFWQERGLWFAVRAIPWHWFYYFYSGLAFAIVLARTLFRKPAVRAEWSSPMNSRMN